MRLLRNKKGKSRVLSGGFCSRDSEAKQKALITILAYVALKC